jgi:hypothetical protein
MRSVKIEVILAVFIVGPRQLLFQAIHDTVPGSELRETGYEGGS